MAERHGTDKGKTGDAAALNGSELRRAETERIRMKQKRGGTEPKGTELR